MPPGRCFSSYALLHSSYMKQGTIQAFMWPDSRGVAMLYTDAERTAPSIFSAKVGTSFGITIATSSCISNSPPRSGTDVPGTDLLHLHAEAGKRPGPAPSAGVPPDN